MPLELVTFEELQQFMGLERGESSHDGLVDIIIPSVQSAIEDFLDRLLFKEERTEVIRIGSTPTRFVDLKAVPVESVSSVVANVRGVDSTLTEYSDFEISDTGLECYSALSGQKITVIYTGGFSNSKVPAAIKRAALIQAVHEYQVKEHVGAESVTTEGGTVNRPGLTLLSEVKRILKKQKHPSSL